MRYRRRSTLHRHLRQLPQRLRHLLARILEVLQAAREVLVVRRRVDMAVTAEVKRIALLSLYISAIGTTWAVSPKSKA